MKCFDISYSPMSIFAQLCGSFVTALLSANPDTASFAPGAGVAVNAILGGLELKEGDSNVRQKLEDAVNKAWDEIAREYRLEDTECLSELRQEIFGEGTTVENHVYNKLRTHPETAVETVACEILKKHRDELNNDPEYNWDNDYTWRAAKKNGISPDECD